MLLKDKKIFIVEDDATNLAIISSILRRNGATVYSDMWGVDALNRMTRLNDVDIILLDLMLPRGVSGYEVYDELRTVPELDHIPIVIVSASDASVEMNKARSKGISGFISKPIDHKTFAELIAMAISGESIWVDS